MKHIFKDEYLLKEAPTTFDELMLYFDVGRWGDKGAKVISLIDAQLVSFKIAEILKPMVKAMDNDKKGILHFYRGTGSYLNTNYLYTATGRYIAQGESTFDTSNLTEISDADRYNKAFMFYWVELNRIICRREGWKYFKSGSFPLKTQELLYAKYRIKH